MFRLLLVSCWPLLTAWPHPLLSLSLCFLSLSLPLPFSLCLGWYGLLWLDLSRSLPLPLPLSLCLASVCRLTSHMPFFPAQVFFAWRQNLLGFFCG